MTPSPTPMPDGTQLLGVIYDCGGWDLLVYEDMLCALVGTEADAWTSGFVGGLAGAPAGLTFGRGEGDGAIPALGPMRRPEARRLEAVLAQGSRKDICTRQFDAAKAQNDRRPGSARAPWWCRLDDVEEAVLHLPNAGTAWLALRVKHDGSTYWKAYPPSTNDRRHIRTLLDAALPGRWREASRSEWSVVRRTLPGVRAFGRLTAILVVVLLVGAATLITGAILSSPAHHATKTLGDVLMALGGAVEVCAIAVGLATGRRRRGSAARRPRTRAT